MFATTLLGIRSLSSPSRLAARGRQQVLLRGMAAAPPASTKLELELVEVDNPNALNFILGQAHFIQTADDLAEVCARHAVPKFGVAFCEASEGHPAMPGRRVRSEGNDADLEQLAAQNALKLGAGHSFILFMDGAFPGDERKGILGVLDGLCPTQMEGQEDKKARKDFLRMVGYKR